MNGFLCVDKSPGMTSRDAVNVVQRIVRPVKVGHAGTLDPMATGVLVMALGRATKLISYVQQMPKFYSASFEFGKTSDTEDITGAVEIHEVVTPPTRAEVDQVADHFVGEIMQLPPKYSALRVKGQRAHALARAGREVVLEPRPIEIHELSVTRYEYPELQLDVKCGSGTYIRSLGRDIGERLGCGAVMSALRRTQIGGFHVNDAVTTEQLSSQEEVQLNLLPLICGVDIPTVVVTSEQLQGLRFGRKIECKTARLPEFAAVDDRGDLLAVMKRVDGTLYRPAINFVAT